MTTPPPSRTSAYQCAICKEQYSRPDHLIRHVRTHTKQRPFVCSVCARAFARQDLLKRHSLAHHNPGPGDPADTGQNPDALADSRRYGPRVQQACRSCAIKKLKCTDSKPCRRCTEKSISCDYDEGPDLLQHEMQMETAMDSTNNESLPVARSDACDTPKSPEMTWPQVQKGVETSIQATAFAQPVEASEPVDTANLRRALGDFDIPMAEVENSISSHNVGSPDVLGCTFDLPSFGDFIQQEVDPDFGDLDLPFFPDFFMTPAVQLINDNSCNSAAVQSPVMGMGTEAYRGSHVHKGWNPGPEDKNSETESLELPSNVRSEVLSTLRNRNLTIRKDDLTVRTRDKILAMIYSRTSKSIWERMSTTFESVDVLKSIIHHAFLYMQEKQMITFIHIASFNLNEQRPELLSALIAYGAVCLPSATMRTFGYGLQELVRIALEEERTSVRDLGVAQAYYIQLYLGFFSGISAKIEVAESSSMLGPTILRRNKMFQAGNYQPPETFLSLEGLSLQQKWSKWVEQESRTRLVYFAMLLDAEVSLARNINPLFAYSEIAIPLPAACRLWEAASADQWYDILVRDSKLRLHQAHPIKRLLREPQLIRADQNIVDTTAAGAAMLAGYWALVYEYRQMEALHSGVQDWNNFVLSSRHAELTSLLDQLKMELTDLENVHTQVVLLQELILLHLNAAYYEISAYSGRGTMEDAQAAKPYVQWWFESQQARHTIWHASQIFRFAKVLRPGALSDISVIALYHATETMWVWGLMQRTQHTSIDASSTLAVVLDEDENPAVTKFLRISRGQPGVTGSTNCFVPLVEPALISDLANEIIKANCGVHTQPWTTSEVSRLVQGFSKICRQRLAEW